MKRSEVLLGLVATGGVISLLLTTACVPAAIGVGALTEAAIAEERGLGVTVGDAGIRSAIHAKVMRYNLQVFNALNFKVREGKVLITGGLNDPLAKTEVLRLVWTVNGVREVVDEIKLGRQGGFGDYARDAWITTQIKSKMLFTRDIQSRNYSIDTVGAVVYIMGVGQSQHELNLVTDLASRTNYVQKVISHVRIKGPKNSFIEATAPVQDEGLGVPIVQMPSGSDVHVESLPASEIQLEDDSAQAPMPLKPGKF